MKKTKLMLFVALGVLFAYCICTLGIFLASENIVEVMFANQTNKIARSSYGWPETDYYNLSNDNDIAYMLADYTKLSLFPHVAAIYDEQGELVAKSGTGIKVYGGENDNEFYPLDEYLTPEIKRQLTESMNQHKKNGYRISGIDLCKKGEKEIPVSFTIQFYSDDSCCTVKLSDEKPDYTREADDSTNIIMYAVDIDENNYNHDIYSELYEWLLSEKTKEEAGRCAKKGSGSISNEGNIRRGYRRVSIEGKRYCFYEVSGCRPIVETLRSDEFISMMILETFLFVFIAIASFFIADKVYNKGKQLEKSRIAFTGGAAHELKTPLAVIANQCECILENVAPEKNNEYVRSIYDESMRMSRLVATLLQYNKLMLSDKTIKASENISEIALNELKKYEPLMAKKGITAEADVEENLRIKCNAELVALAIDNFLSNAVKFSPKNGRVELSVKRSKSDVKVRVFNTGDGVPIDDRRHIWEEFYIRESSRNSANNSTGMGLAVCKKIFELHGFSYGFKNKKNGVEFYFSANQ